jgi:RNA polymerase sigma-70 factor, ECF subfamily
MLATPCVETLRVPLMELFRLQSPTIDQMLSVGTSAEEMESPRSRPGADETELVRRAQLGSAAAFEQLVLRHGPHVSRYLAVRLSDEAEARDVLQETLTAAWQALPSLREPARIRPWLLGIAVHKAADAARKRPPTSPLEADLPSHDDDDLAIREAVRALPEPFRQVLLLRYLLQLSEEEVAEALGIRVGTVKSRSARARKALMELLR